MAYEIRCSCGCGAQLGTIEVQPESFRGPEGYSSYAPGHTIPGLSLMADGRYVPGE